MIAELRMIFKKIIRSLFEPDFNGDHVYKELVASYEMLIEPKSIAFSNFAIPMNRKQDSNLQNMKSNALNRTELSRIYREEDSNLWLLD